MGFFNVVRGALAGGVTDASGKPLADEDRLVEGGRKLIVPSGYNVRELGGYDTPCGPTLGHRFLRCGGTRSLTRSDLAFFRRWGVTRVLDLRGMGEAPSATCAFARQGWVTWKNVSLFDHDISAPAMVPETEVDNYLVSSYLHMLARGTAVKEAFEFFAAARPNECVLFHCAAGMDRTGMVGLLLLGLAEVSREQVIADYLYSFGPVDKVDAAVAAWGGALPERVDRSGLWARLEAAATVYDTLVATHGSVRNYLASCDISDGTLEAARAHLLV